MHQGVFGQGLQTKKGKQVKSLKKRGISNKESKEEGKQISIP